MNRSPQPMQPAKKTIAMQPQVFGRAVFTTDGNATKSIAAIDFFMSGLLTIFFSFSRVLAPLARPSLREF
jgi:hypothetical protein